MSYYRDTYLKSEDWRNLRAAAISSFSPYGNCTLCQSKPKTLDAHHHKYRKLYDVEPWDLRIVCRKCHTRIHELLKQYPELKSLGRWRQWNLLCHKICPDLYPDRRMRETWEAAQSGHFVFKKGFLYYNNHPVGDHSDESKREQKARKKSEQKNLLFSKSVIGSHC